MIPPSGAGFVAVAKADLRRQARLARRGAAAAGGEAAAQALAVHGMVLAARIGAAGVVAGYWPMADEIDPRPLMARLAGAGAGLALPVVVGPGRALEFRVWAPGQVLEPGPHGTCHPPVSAPVVRPDLVLVPLLAFDQRGMRLGYGGGFYDRTLERLRGQGGVVAVGVAFAVQQVARVPGDVHDQALDMVLTENGPAETTTR